MADRLLQEASVPDSIRPLLPFHGSHSGGNVKKAFSAVSLLHGLRARFRSNRLPSRFRRGRNARRLAPARTPPGTILPSIRSPPQSFGQSPLSAVGNDSASDNNLPASDSVTLAPLLPRPGQSTDNLPGFCAVHFKDMTSDPIIVTNVSAGPPGSPYSAYWYSLCQAGQLQTQIPIVPFGWDSTLLSWVRVLQR